MNVKIAVNRFNKTVEFGAIDSVPNDATGDYDEKFKAVYTVHCALYNRSFMQNYQLLGTELQDTIVLAIRSDSRINRKLIARFNSHDYKIIDVSKDSTEMPVAYDLVTLKLIEKEG
ncbi:phage head closure protein [Furfurilactobacillus siliginis]